MKLLICLCLFAILIIPVIAADIPINEGAIVYPTETQLPRDPITEQSFDLNEESKAEIIEVAPITIDIQPYLSSGMLLNREVEVKELPLQQVVTALVKQNNRGVLKEKIVQMYPESILEISDNAETIKQTTSGDMRLELYYDYQKSVLEPWSKYYKVEKCVDGMCKVVRADFATRIVTVTDVPLSSVEAIVGIPAYEALP